ncbi:MAG: hypothetical protein IPM91_02260 [Bacteroidetes bacterium]|nr:hypothetical protein [Bacteroidota bacterium]
MDTKANFPSSYAVKCVAFTIGNLGYVGTGRNTNYNFSQSFYEYNPTTNMWTAKANFGGTARTNATGFSIGSKGYIGTGYDNTYKNDFWEYDPLLNTWTQKSNFMGSARSSAVGFSINGKGYIGTGWDINDGTIDFYEYNPISNSWKQKANFGGNFINQGVGFSIGNVGYICTGQVNGGGETQELWAYDSNVNIWIQKANLTGLSRKGASAFVIGNKAYIGLGWNTGNGLQKDLWEYTPDGITLNCNASLPSNITNGLVGYWPFCGNANDESGNGNNGIVSGATLAPDRQGTPNSAYTFNGVNSKITIPDNNVYDNQNYSIGFWYKFSTPSTPGSGGNNVNPGIISRVANSSNVTYDNWVVYEAVTLVGFGSGVGGASGVSGTPTGQNNGQWKHVVFSVGADSIRCYVNGLKTSSSLKGGNLTFNNYDIVIGRSSSTYWKAFQGDIDDLALWNRALNDQEVLIYYNDCNSPVISVFGTTTFCQGSNVLLNVNESYSTYQWQKNNVNINGATSKTFTSNSGGTYRSIVSNSCGIDTSNTISLTSLPNKSNTVLVTGNTLFCIGDSVTLNSSNVTAGYSYQWYRNNIAINGATSNTFIGKNPGTYKVITKMLQMVVHEFHLIVQLYR